MRHEKAVFVFALCTVLAVGAILSTPAASARPVYCTQCYYPGAADFNCTCPPGTNRHPEIVTCSEYWAGHCRYFMDTSLDVPLEHLDTGAELKTCVEPASAKPTEQPEPVVAAD